MKRVAYLILNYKTYLDTVRVTDEILGFKKWDDIIIIVDNASPNESSEELHKKFDSHSEVIVVDSPENGGYAKGNNYGLRYAKHIAPRFVCIINNDVHFTGETIDSLCKIYDELPSPALIAPIQVLPNGERARFINFRLPNLLYDLKMNTLFLKPHFQKYESNTAWNNVQRVGYLPGALLFADYTVFERLGFFDECTFLFCEERFTGKAVQNMALNNYIILDRTYIHEHSKTINSEASSKKQRQLIHEGRLLYYERYSKMPRLSKTLLKLSYHFHGLELKIISTLRK